ncbi:hypothetical protein [Dactylosporangium sp. NPDC005555]|uniref:hypothetical protein n=1 Tax=Dactylosporangium sp. NPDC005555 TaxID=3154889 RepID=UPI0033AFCA58
MTGRSGAQVHRLGAGQVAVAFDQPRQPVAGVGVALFGGWLVPAEGLGILFPLLVQRPEEKHARGSSCSAARRSHCIAWASSSLRYACLPRTHCAAA